ncbi:zinc-binding dehydrogenase [Streptomyces sp. W16]|uniref:zinc-binding dehydrogenase n=1 Tax=Streptomyces sp. W16 TaxID=3076631 RepID=UPI00295AAB9B|nr:zinc-binding dehydrogenase [Streptomyces sp. W16]MDV9174038.1 zinc-binding dehydrogenase [Streptomyces sp. W16]
MTPLTVLLGDYPHTRRLKETPVLGGDCRFVESSPLYPAFAHMVRELAYDVCELALATYLQARAAGVPVTLLPVVMIGGTHHRSLTRLPDGPHLTPGQLVGRRVGVRSYSQTTGLWVRGILREEYGVEASDITWVTTEEPHVAQYREPACVRRSQAGRVADLLRAAAPDGIDAFVDTFGQGNVDIAIELGVAPQRINTLADGRAVARHGVRSRAQEDVFTPQLVAELAELVSKGLLTVHISEVYPLEQVQEAYRQVQRRHTRGKIVLSLVPPDERPALAGELRAARPR